MRIVLKDVKGLFSHFNGRSEMHGEEREPAGDVSLKAMVPNSFLDQLHGTLKHALYFHDTENPGRDLADKAMEENPEYLPHRRLPSIPVIPWAEEMVGGKLTIAYGVGGRSDLVLSDIKLNNLKLAPKDGGSVEITFRVQAKPDEKQAGRLYSLIQKEVTFSIEPPVAQEDLAGAAPVVTT